MSGFRRPASDRSPRPAAGPERAPASPAADGPKTGAVKRVRKAPAAGGETKGE